MSDSNLCLGLKIRFALLTFLIGLSLVACAKSPGTNSSLTSTSVTEDSEQDQTEDPTNSEDPCGLATLDEAYEVCQLVNIERHTAGLEPLTYSALLEPVMQAHTQEMFDYKYLNHTNRQGQSPFDRLKAAGIKYGWAGENIAQGQNTPEKVMSSWMNSSGHRANILHSSYKKIAVGYVGGYWGQLFTD